MNLALLVAISSCLLALIPIGVIRGLGEAPFRAKSIDKDGPHGRLARLLEF
jgi:hypothetical protein